MSTKLYDPDAELERLYAAITGRPAFSYDPASDPVYNSYAQSYQRRGRLAMRDTMGQAAALTGGYGSSYAQSVGQQQYDSYLQSLGEALPELYGMAWQRYNAEGDALKTAWELASGCGKFARAWTLSLFGVFGAFIWPRRTLAAFARGRDEPHRDVVVG